MAVKTIFDLTGNVALDLANDVLHLWQPAASGELDRKVTLQGVATLLNTNTTFSNIPYLDKENTFAENMNLDKILNIGGNPAPTEPLEVYSAADDVSGRIQTAKVNGIAGLILENDAQSWQPRVDDFDRFIIRDVTNSQDPLRIVPGAPTGSQHIAASGDIGFGRIPTADFDFYRISTDITVRIETDKVNGVSGFQVGNDAQIWEARVNTDDNFHIRDITGGVSPFIIEPAAPNNSLFIDSAGLIGFGQPVPLFDLDISALADSGIRLNAPAAQKASIRLSDGDTTRWKLHSDGTSANEFFIQSAAGNYGFSIEQSAVNYALYIASGGVLIGQNAVDGTGASLQVGGNISLRGLSDQDRALLFTSTVAINWNETRETFDIANEKFVQGAWTVEGASLTENEIFDALDLDVPNTNDILKISGHLIVAAAAYEIVYAIRQSSSTIELFGISAGSLNSVVLTDGGATNATEVRLAY